MMRRLLLALVAVSAIACTPFYGNPAGYTVNHGNLDESWRKVASMNYIYSETTIYNQSPKEFFAAGGGNCAGFSTALVYLLGPGSYVLGITEPLNNHAIVEYQGEYLEPQIYGKRYTPGSVKIKMRLSYDTIMQLSTHFGSKGF